MTARAERPSRKLPARGERHLRKLPARRGTTEESAP
jgi:hypothetical protein